VVVGKADGAIKKVFTDMAKAVNAPIVVVDEKGAQPFTLDLEGAHQQENARTAFSAIKILRDKWGIPLEAIERGMANVRKNTGLRGRWEVIGRDPLTIADVAHNEDGIRAVRQQLSATPHDHLHIVLGTVSDKDLGRMLALLPRTAGYYFCKADIPRGLDAELLRSRAMAAGTEGRSPRERAQRAPGGPITGRSQ
jgi:dihydrofolate synthase/folylpolyglutamate synthase